MSEPAAPSPLPPPAVGSSPARSTPALPSNRGWERLDTPAATPAGRRRLGSSSTAAGATVRLRRHGSPVLGALDGGGSVLQRRGRHVLVGSSLLLLPVVVLNLWATTLAFERDGGTTLSAFGGDRIGTGIEDVAAVLVVLCAGLAAAVVGAFATAILVGDRFGTVVGAGTALRDTTRRLPSVLAAWVIGHAWTPFAAAWALTGPSSSTAGRVTVTLMFAAVASSVTLYVVPAIVVEGLGPLRALRRSWQLCRLRFGSTLGFVVSSAAVGGLLLAGITFLPALLTETGFVTYAGWDWLVQGLAGQLAVIVVVPLVALATAQLYLEVRLDAEGMDLVIDAEAAFPSTVGGGR